VTTTAVENLMGRSTMQVLAGIHDAMAHQAPEAVEYSKEIAAKGVSRAAGDRDAKFS
jgi:hypothetical protein